VLYPPLELDSVRRVHGHSCSNQARRKKLEKQLGKLEQQLSGLRAARKALGHLEREVVGAKKRVLSAAGRAAIVTAARKRWAKVRKKAKNVAG
jgi:hypothetical protein